jgi:hypothetical protein
MMAAQNVLVQHVAAALEWGADSHRRIKLCKLGLKLLVDEQ